MTNSQRLAEIRKKREGGEQISSSSLNSSKKYTNSQRLEKRQLERSIKLDSFESDLSDMNNTLFDIYSGWQTADTMAGTKSSLEAMKNRLADYQTYTRKYGSGDTGSIDAVLSAYQTAADDWDDLTGVYGYYKNADAYNAAKQKAEYDELFKGLTYDEVQSKLKEYDKASGEYEYLSNYKAYSDLKEFDKAIDSLNGKSGDLGYLRALEKARNQYALDNTFDLYKDYLDKEDFEEKSQYVSTIENKDFLWWDYEKVNDYIYEAINAESGAERQKYIDSYKSSEWEMLKNGLPDYINAIGMMTDEEKGVFNYKYNEESEESAYDYLEDMEAMLTKRLTDSVSEGIKKTVDNSAAASAVLSGLSVPLNIAGGMATGLDVAKNALTGQKSNPYSTARLASNMAADVRSEVGENIAEATDGMELFGQNIPAFLYQTGMSVGDTVLGAAMFGKAFTPIMGANAYQQTARELTEAGEDDITVVGTSLVSGAAEMVFEYLGIDNLFKIKDVNSLKTAIMAALKQAGAEGTEEVLTEIVNITADTIFRRDSSELVSMYNGLIERGYTETEAGIELAKQIGSQAVWAFAGGALSGTALGGATSAGLYSNYRANENAKTDTKNVDIPSEGEVTEKTVSVNNADLKARAEKMSPEMAEVFISQYDGKSDIRMYEASFEMAYNYGETGMGAETALKNRGILTERQTAEIYKAAIRNRAAARRTEIDKINTKHASETKGVFDDSVIDYNNTSAKGKVNWNSLTSTQRGAVTFAKGFSKATGVNIKFVASKVENGRRTSENGSYNPDTNTIEIDVYAGIMDSEAVNDSIIPTLSHELTHWMKDKASDMYDNMREYIVNSLENSGTSVDQLMLKRMELMEQAHPGTKVTEEMAIDEIVARSCEDMLSNSEAAREFLSGLSKKDKNVLIEKVKEIFNNLKTWVNELLRKYKASSPEARVLRAYGDKVNELSKMWDETLKEAVKANRSMQKNGENNNQAEEAKAVQYSIREEYASEIEAWARAGKPEGEVFVLGSTGDVLQGLGAIESDIYMMGDKIKTILKRHPEMTLDEIKKIPQVLERPVLILISKNVGRAKKNNTRLVIFGSVKAKDGRPILSVLDLRPSEKNLIINDMQKVSSAYTKDDAPEEFIRASKVMYIDKKITASFLRTMGFVAPIELNESGYIGSISYTDQNVKLEGKKFADIVSEKNKDSHQAMNVPNDTNTTTPKATLDMIPFKNSIPQNIENTTEKIQYYDREDFDIFMDVFVKPDAAKERSGIISEDVARLKERLSLSGKAKVSEKNLGMIAGYMLKNTNSTYDVQSFKKDLDEVYTYIAESDSPEWEIIMAKCNDAARNVIEKQKGVDIKNNYFRSMLDEVRKARIALSEEQIQAAIKEYGDRYRNKFFGKIILAKDGVSLDSQWMKWSEKYPEIFDKDITPGEQVTALYDIYNILRESAAIYETYNEAAMIRTLGTEIYNQYWLRSDIEGVSEAQEQRIKELNFEHRKTMKKLRENYKADDKEQTYINIIKKLQRQVKKEREEGRLRVNKYRYRVKKNNLIKRITKNALTLNQWIVKNSKGKHVADVMKGPVVHLLNAIDFSSKQLLGLNGNVRDYTETKQDISLSAALEKVHRMIKDGVSAEVSEDDITELHASLAGLPADFIERLTELSSKANDVVRKLGDNSYVLNKMEYAELETLEELVTVLKKTVQETNELYASSVSGGVPALAQDSIQHMNSMGSKKKAESEAGKALNKLTRWDNSLPYYVFKRFGEGGMKIYESLQNGWDKLAFLIRDVIEFAKTVYTAKEVKEWSREVIEFNIDKPKLKVAKDNIDVKSEKQTIKLTVAQIMSLYCLNKREQGRQHILQGGIRAGDIKVKGKKLEQAEGIILAESKLDEIIGRLTDRQREVADKLQSYLTKECAELGNEVTMRRFGIKAFGDPNYFPIKTDASLTNGDAARDSQPGLFRLLNMSFTKDLDEHAKNKIVVENIFDVFAEHTSNMAKYNALALPVLDACKWFMYKESGAEREGGADEESSVRKSMEVAFGKEAINYVNTFLKDINGQENGDRDVMAKEFFRRAKLASVGANLRVVALQPTSYLRASAVIDPKYLAKAALHLPQIDKAKKWCGIALWKSFGFYDINVGRKVTELIKHSKTVMDKITEGSLKGAEVADSVTWGYLWNACEAEIKDKRKDLRSDSDEFNKAVGKRLREVIYATQVVDSTMTRSHMMRSKSWGDQLLTSFASEPTLSYNMLQDVCYDWSMTKRQKGSAAAFKKHGRKMVRVLAAYTVTNAVTALVEAVFDAYRDEEDMEAEEFVKQFFANFVSNMDVLGKIPYFKEIIGAYEGFTASRLEMQWIQYSIYSINGIIKLVNGEDGSAYTTLKNLIRALSSLSSLPVYNAWRETEAFLNRTGILETEELKEIIDETLGEVLPSLKSK